MKRVILRLFIFLSIVFSNVLVLSAQSNEPPYLDFDSRINVGPGQSIDFIIPIVDPNNDILDLEISNLPDWLTLERTLNLEATFLADFEYASADEHSTSTLNDLEVDKEGNWFWLEYGKIRYTNDGAIIKDSIDVASIEGGFELNSAYQLEIYDDQFFIVDFEGLRLYRIKDNIMSLIAGNPNSDQRIIIDGQGERASFHGIKSIAKDNKGGFYVLDDLQVRHITSDGVVTTVAGTGDYGYQDGNASQSVFNVLYSLFVREDKVFIFELIPRVRLLMGNEVSTLFYGNHQTTNLIGAIEHFYVDPLGNLYFFNGNGFEIFDSEGDLIQRVRVRNEPNSGSIAQMGWRDFVGLNTKTPGEFVFADVRFGDIRKLSYSFSYKLHGAPEESDFGSYDLDLSFTDGKGDVVSASLNLIAGPVAGVENENVSVEIKTYPSPANSFVTLEFSSILMKGTEVRVTGANGVQFLNSVIAEPTRSIKLNISSIPEGVHVVSVMNDGQILRKKFMIAR